MVSFNETKIGEADSHPEAKVGKERDEERKSDELGDQADQRDLPRISSNCPVIGQWYVPHKDQ